MQYDQMTGINYFSSYSDCQATCMSYIRCPELELVQNALNSSNGNEGWGEVITYTCQEGYSFIHNSERKRECQRDGTWSADEPVCKADCLVPDVPASLRIQPVKDVFRFGDPIYYYCNVGDRVGDEFRTCGDNGEWSGTEPTCAETTQCQHPTAIRNGVRSSNNPDAITSVGTTITYTCNSGYTLVGNGTQECLESGNWSAVQPVCTKMRLISNEGNATIEDELEITNSTLVLRVEQRDVTLTCSLVGLDIAQQSPVVWAYDREGYGNYMTVVGQYIDSNGTVRNFTEGPHGVRQTLDGGISKLSFTKILSSQEEQSGRYRCTAGIFSAFFDLESMDSLENTKQAPELLLGPRNVNLLMGEEVMFSCVFKSCPYSNVSWDHDNRQIHDVDGRVITHDVPITMELTLSQLEISRVNSSDEGVYRCLGVNEIGTTPSLPARLTLSSEGQERRRRNTICSNTDPDTVTLVGRVKRQPGGESSIGFDSYRVHIQRILSDSPDVVVTQRKTIRVISIRSSNAQSARLKTGESYIFSGKFAQDMLIVDQESIQARTSELESAVRQC